MSEIIDFYEHLVAAKRERSWSLPKKIKPAYNEAWFCCGDFYEITYQNEKAGANLQPQWQMEAFKEAIETCTLSVIPILGQKLSWSNNR